MEETYDALTAYERLDKELDAIAHAHFLTVHTFSDYSATLIGWDGYDNPYFVEHTFHFAPTSVYALLQKKFRDNRERTRA